MTSPSLTASDRRRAYSGPALFSYGFRPFFLFGSLYAGLALPLWLAMLFVGVDLPGVFPGTEWHVHEMIFGFLAAVVSGFILTAIPNWTGRLPVMGAPLAHLFLVWLLGRVAVTFIPHAWFVLVLDAAFLVLLSAFVWREVLSGKNWRNAPVCLLVSLLTVANILFHLGLQFDSFYGYGTRLALGAAAVLISLIGGRITPSFTRNWMARENMKPVPVQFGHFDRVAMACAVTAMMLWVALPEAIFSGVLLLIAGILNFVRLLRWRGIQAAREPIVLILHMGYGWLAFSFVAMGLAILSPDLVDAYSALHALTAGAIGVMTLAVMTRASLGHTGRAITANPVTLAMYILVTLGALLRICATSLPLPYQHVLIAGGMAWSVAFLLFFIAYAPILLRTQQR